ncbi:serine aminopeptidase domain-containing protein [Hymenobacter ruricola]|uniref:Alpha/beta hydrolase n=1 Tax=Hymenobacter ruricola TaxID=2791023 RepID=A0ABS0I634_9BACT|nr:alpha/beta hydrolase [Hymenobacter ruricola]MBF9222406.1 alpha/beta hydrolase [Hymenobacter ruricola]
MPPPFRRLLTRPAWALLALLASACSSSHPPAWQAAAPPLAAPVTADSLLTTRLELYDDARQRAVPVVVYQPATSNPNAPRKVAILSHGYGGSCTGYSFLARCLVAHGYLVASVQHELPTDAPMPTTGVVSVVRRPSWERGVQNIEFARQQLRQRYPHLDFNHLLLAGHSNGGDVSVLYAAHYPDRVERVISLDNRRVPLPRARRPRVLTLRSSDQVADPGVLPTPAEQRRFGTVIVPLAHTIHNDMWDGATEAQKQEMNEAVTQFLEH